jgi:phosphate-selective porin OprO/OprP
MKKRDFNGVIKVLLVMILLAMLMPSVADAQQNEDVRIEKLEAQQQALQAELENLKADRAQAGAGPSDFRVFWKEGLNLATRDGDFKMKIGGRIMFDSTWVSEDSDIKSDLGGDQEDGTEFRRARLYTSGLIHDNVEFKLQFDFTGGDADLKDAYLGLIDFPIGRIRAGHFKEPFGLEELTSSKYITFIERSLPTGAFSPSRNAGVMLFGNALAASEPRMTWAAGIFKETDNNGEVHDDGGYSLTGRVTGLPCYKNKGASLLHVGAAFSARETTDNTQSYDTEPEAHLLDDFVDTGDFASENARLLGLEMAWVDGPLSVQGEYIRADADASSTGNFSGYYIQTSYFLTGEHRKYKPSAGAFSRVKPKENYAFGGGTGAWEVALRYSSIDLDDSSVDGGELDNITTGLNWYLNPNTRLMCNYVHADKDDIGNADIFVTRLQIDF